MSEPIPDYSVLKYTQLLNPSITGGTISQTSFSNGNINYTTLANSTFQGGTIYNSTINDPNLYRGVITGSAILDCTFDDRSIEKLKQRISPEIDLSMEIQKAGSFLIVKIELKNKLTGAVIASVEEEVDID